MAEKKVNKEERKKGGEEGKKVKRGEKIAFS